MHAKDTQRHQDGDAAAPDELVAVSWNIHRGRGGDGRVDPDRVLRTLRDEVCPKGSAHILGLKNRNAATTQLLAAACLIAVIPALIVFVALQRMIVCALTARAVKG